MSYQVQWLYSVLEAYAFGTVLAFICQWWVIPLKLLYETERKEESSAQSQD